jgi:GT2 family glycosyltransferase
VARTGGADSAGYHDVVSSADAAVRDRVGVVIVNYNAGDVILRALGRLREQTVPAAHVIVVDNASTDGSVARIATEHPWVEIVEAGTNTGFAAGNNIGIRMLGDCEWIALLNPDAFPEPAWLEELIDASRRRPEYDFFASLLLDDDDPTSIDGAGDAYHPSGLAWRLQHGVALADGDLAEVEVFSPCAAAALYRRSAIEDVGLFDERWFCYLEDIDLAFRLRLQGARCLFVPSSRVRHMGSVVTGRESEFTLYHSHRNVVWTWVRNMPGPLMWRSLPHLILGTALSIGFYSTRGQFKTLVRAKRDGFAALPWLLRERRKARETTTVDWRELQAAMQSASLGYKTAAGRARQALGRISPIADSADGEP